jgi:hypothetical protein
LSPGRGYDRPVGNLKTIVGRMRRLPSKRKEGAGQFRGGVGVLEGCQVLIGQVEQLSGNNVDIKKGSMNDNALLSDFKLYFEL